MGGKGKATLTGEGLGPGADALQVLAAGQALVADEVGEEVVQVAGEVILVALSDEGEYGRGPVGPLEQLPGHAGEGGVRDGRAGGGDGAGAAVRAEPDHNLVRVGAAGARGGEEVVGDVGDHVGAGVALRREA